jgi:hypothetical protein
MTRFLFPGVELAGRSLGVLGLAALLALPSRAGTRAPCGRSTQHVARSAQRDAGHGREPLRPVSGLRASDAATRQRVWAAYGRLPLAFEPNTGQSDPRVKFLARGPGYTLGLLPTEAVFVLHTPARRKGTIIAGLTIPRKFSLPKGKGKWKPARPVYRPGGRTTLLRMQLLGSNPAARITGRGRLPGTSNYLRSSNPKKWHTEIPTYARVRYQGVYPGVDLVYYGNQRQLEYDFVVAPGAEPGRVRLAFGGARRVWVDRGGDLVVQTAGGDLRQRRPVIYQEVGGRRREVPGGYLVDDRGRVGFRVAAYDRTRPLVIDPSLVYSTYLGGDVPYIGMGIAVDGQGNAYVTGITGSDSLTITGKPSVSGSLNVTGKPSISGGLTGSVRVSGISVSSTDFDAFVAKVNPTGTALVYSTYLGGTGADVALGIAVDGSGNAYVTGVTGSEDFPVTTGAAQTTYGGSSDAFVAKVNPTGTALVYATYLGGTVLDAGIGIAVDSSGNAYVTGVTASTDFPTTTGAFQTALSGLEAFVTKVNATGTALVYSTYLGSDNLTIGIDIAVDGQGSAYVTGLTLSPNFPTTTGAFQTDEFGGDAFVTKLNAAGTALVYSTYLGGSNIDIGIGIAVDGQGNAYVTGATFSTDFPTTTGAFQTDQPDADAFVTKVNATGTALAYSTYLGGSGTDVGLGIAVDGQGNAYVTGTTASSDFPTTAGAFQTSHPATDPDVFVSKVNGTGTALAYSTYLGGTSADVGLGIAVDGSGNAYVTGLTGSTDFPTTAGAYQSQFGSSADAFVTKLATGGTGAIVAVLKENNGTQIRISNLGTAPTFVCRGNSAGGTSDDAFTVCVDNQVEVGASSLTPVNLLPASLGNGMGVPFYFPKPGASPIFLTPQPATNPPVYNLDDPDANPATHNPLPPGTMVQVMMENRPTNGKSLGVHTLFQHPKGSCQLFEARSFFNTSRTVKRITQVRELVKPQACGSFAAAGAGLLAIADTTPSGSVTLGTVGSTGANPTKGMKPSAAGSVDAGTGFTTEFARGGTTLLTGSPIASCGATGAAQYRYLELFLNFPPGAVPLQPAGKSGSEKQLGYRIDVQ